MVKILGEIQKIIREDCRQVNKWYREHPTIPYEARQMLTEEKNKKW